MDAGGLYHRTGHPTPEQMEGVVFKTALAAELVALSGVDAMGLAPGDLAAGWDQVKALAAKHALPYLAANLTCGLDHPFPASRVVERNGIEIGFVGAYVGAFPVEGCTVEDPVAATAAAVNALPEVDAVVVLGAFNAEKGKEIAVAAPRVAFVVSSDNLNLPDPQPLTPDVWLLGSGSRGKNLGLLQATLVPGATGWQTLKPGATLAERTDRFRARLKTAQERLAAASDDASRKRMERQVEFYEKEIARMEGELQAATVQRTTPANTFTSTLVPLAKTIADHPATRARLDAVAADLAKYSDDRGTGGLPPDLKRPPIPLGGGPQRDAARPEGRAAPRRGGKAPPAGGGPAGE